MHRVHALVAPFFAVLIALTFSPGTLARESDSSKLASSQPVELSSPIAEGELSTLTYNVAGLPQRISEANPAQNTPLISPLLNAYDVVLVQEDFWYHQALSADVQLSYRSVPLIEEPTLLTLGDGLNRFSRFEHGELVRHGWDACNGLTSAGWDCIATKGFSVAEMTLAEGVTVDVYNVHLDAGGSRSDAETRSLQVDQLLDTLQQRSSDRPVILAGDTNLARDRSKDNEVLDRLLASANLLDACDELGCGVDRLDRVLYRSAPGLTLEPIEYNIPDNFRHPGGEHLSDHAPVAVRFRWRASAIQSVATLVVEWF